MQRNSPTVREMLVEAISLLIDYASEEQVDREVLLSIGDDYCESDLIRLQKAEAVIQKYREFKVTQGFSA